MEIDSLVSDVIPTMIVVVQPAFHDLVHPLRQERCQVALEPGQGRIGPQHQEHGLLAIDLRNKVVLQLQEKLARGA